MGQILFAIQSGQSRSLPLSAQRLVNLFMEAQPQDSKSQTPLFGTPGLVRLGLFGTGPIRGMWLMRGQVYAVSGSQLYAVSSGGIATLIVGPPIGGTRPVSMADNGYQLVIVNGGQGYCYNMLTNVFLQITDPDFHGANTVTYFDGYFVFDWAGTDKFFLSNLRDGMAYDSFDAADAESGSDNVVAVVDNLQVVFIFCETRIETWYDAGTENFPFQRYTGALIERGTIAPGAIVKADSAVFFIGDDKVPYRLQGNIPIPIGTPATAHAFTSYPDLGLALGFTYTLEGHKMVVFTFPQSGHTWEYDISTKLWHERESWDAKNVSLGRWRANCCLEAYDGIMIGDAYDGTIGFMNWDIYTEYGNTIHGIAYSAPIHQDRKRVFIPRIELDFETGVGLTTGQGSDPQVMLSVSKDGGKTFSTQQRWKSLGKIGKYLQRLRWDKWGWAYQFVFRLEITDPVKRVFIAAHADIRIGV